MVKEMPEEIWGVSKNPLLKTVFILGLIGVGRNVLEVLIGGDWARAWFSFSPDIFFTMFFYPVFLCFFGSMILYFFSQKVGLQVSIKKIFFIVFALQLLHLAIPFLDGLAHLYNLPYRLYYNFELYKKLIFSPIALTPLIMLFTWPTSLGIDVAWVFTSAILINLYIGKWKFPVGRSLLVLGISFYLTYMAVYPAYIFLLNELLTGSNFMFGLFFLLSSVPSTIYVRKIMLTEKD